jgi:anti-sigma-K factor RskA
MIDHEAIDELLAGYVLGSLTGEDAEAADRLLTDHVPDCADCLATLDAFQGLTGDIALVAAPATVPETVLPRLHRSLDGRRSRRMPAWHPGRLVAAAAAAVALIGVAGLAITQVGGDAGSQRLTQADLQVVNDVANRSDAVKTPLGAAEEVTAPGLEEIYLRGSGVPSPPDGSTYRLWAVSPGGAATYLGDFVPVAGAILLEIAIDPTAVDHLLITLAPAGSDPGEPGQPAPWATAS